MDRQATQFWVAIIGVAGLVAATLASVIGSAFGDVPAEMSFALITGLVSVTSGAIAWLFRLNNHNR